MKNFIAKKYKHLHRTIKFFILLLTLPLIYDYIPVKKGKSTFYIHSTNVDTVIDTLNENGYGLSAIDKIMLKYIKPPSIGWYRIKSISKDRFGFFDSLSKQKAKTIRVKIYAGENSIELTKRLAKNLHLSSRKLLLQYRSLTKYLEGDIFAGYYRVPRRVGERAVISALFEMSKVTLHKFASKHCNAKKPNPLEIRVLLILASIIQKETNNKKEMVLVSSVIQNRLKKGMKLQMDGTLNYGKYSHKRVTPRRIRKDKSYYNTYKHGGIPPAPLCSVTVDALQAALNPAKTNYLYFMLNRRGKHDFASSYKTHAKNIRAFRRR